MTLSDSVGVTRSSLASVAGSSAVTEQQRLERRERNREHAKRSRIRKKFLLESLQDQVGWGRGWGRGVLSRLAAISATG